MTFVRVIAGCSFRAWLVAAPVMLAVASVGCDRRPVASSSAQEPSAQDVQDRQLVLDSLPEKDYPHLHNLLRVTNRVYSGSEPKEEAAFAELKQLGIRTIVSVDGARPKIELAEKYGMRYVHIPIGYDGVDDAAGGALARLVREASGPFYVHCHHGRHRGPAAAAVACAADGAVAGTEAHKILEAAGTSPDYAGLWRDVAAYVPPADDEPLPELVAVAPVESMAAAMATIDRSSDHLKSCAANQWRTPADHPDVVPEHEALLVKEGFREIIRQLEVENPYDDAFLQAMRDSLADAELLEAALKSNDPTSADALHHSLQTQCKSCHQEYRD